MTPVFCCGFECGVYLAHWSAASAITFDTTTKRNGDRSARVNPSAATKVHTRTVTSSNVKVERVYIRFATLPDADTVIYWADVSTFKYGVYYSTSDTKLYAGRGTTLEKGATGVTVTTGVWYRIDLKVNLSANPRLVDVSVDGTACGQYSHAAAATSSTSISFGSSESVTCDYYVDDIIGSETLGDFPIGAGYVNHFVPTADGTHNIAGTGDFQRGNTGTDILNATTTAYQLVDDVPLPSGTVDEADCQRAVAPPNATDYVEGVFGPASGISTPTVAPRAVEAILAYHQVATQTGMMKVDLNDNGTVDSILNITPATAGVTSYRYARKHYAAGPAGAWTIGGGGNGDFTDLRFRFYSADPSPDQCLDGIMIEAEFAPGGPTTVEADGSATGAGVGTGVSGATAKVDLASTNLATVTGVGVALTLSTGSAVGASTDTATSAIVLAGDGAAVGAATPSVVGTSVFTATGSAVGASTDQAIASATALAEIASAGAATPAIAGTAIGTAIADSDGAAVVDGQGEDAGGGTVIVEADAAAAGAATPAIAGAAIGASLAASDGAATPSITASSLFTSTASSIGLATPTTLAAALTLGEASSAGQAVSTGLMLSFGTAVASSAGVATPSFDGEDAASGFTEADAASQGAATSTGVSGATAGSLAVSQGTATSTGVAGQTISASFSATGSAVGTGVSGQTISADASAAGAATVLGESPIPAPTLAESTIGATAVLADRIAAAGVSVASVPDLIASPGLGAVNITVIAAEAGAGAGVVADRVANVYGAAVVGSTVQASIDGTIIVADLIAPAGLVASL